MLHAQLAEENLDVRALKAADLTAHMHMLFATARVNGDVRDALQCLRFDGYQTGLLCRRWHIGDTSSSTPAQQRTKGEMKRHFNGIVESEERGLDRLDPTCYQLVAQRVGLEPHDIIYVDTRKELLVSLPVSVSVCPCVRVCACLPACPSYSRSSMLTPAKELLVGRDNKRGVVSELQQRQVGDSAWRQRL